ncbi:MAG: hypothetical protein WA399_15220 [Acidobacteriaceae bacterium]
MPAQYVKPYAKTNKNDYVDAIAEAVGRANTWSRCTERGTAGSGAGHR